VHRITGDPGPDPGASALILLITGPAVALLIAFLVLRLA
jgi:hypothetical protein